MLVKYLDTVDWLFLAVRTAKHVHFAVVSCTRGRHDWKRHFRFRFVDQCASINHRPGVESFQTADQRSVGRTETTDDVDHLPRV